MTIADLLAKISAAFPAFNARAVEALAPAYRARFEKHEGPALRDAWLAVSGSFVPGKAGLFPLPQHFEPHLPGQTLKLPDEAGIRQALAERAERKRRVFAAWHEGQGAKIRAARPTPVFNACLYLAMTLAAKKERVLLTQDEIKTCEDRALSQGRIAMFGALPRTNDEWDAQIERVRESWTAHQRTGEAAA